MLITTPTDARSVEVRLTLQKQAYKQVVNESYNTRMVFRKDEKHISNAT